MKDLSSATEQELLTLIHDKSDAFREDIDGCEYMRFVWSKAQDYANAMDVSPLHVLQKFEGRRNYCTVNYYQEANFPSLDRVHVFETQAELKGMVDKGFRCPSCKGVSKSPYECDTGLKMSKKEVCNWKSYGFFGTMGTGLTFTVKDTFFDHCKVDECFYPVAMESATADAA